MSASFEQLKPYIQQLRVTAPGIYGSVTVTDEVHTVADAEHTNGHKQGSTEHTLRHFYIDGKPVSLVDAAKAIYQG